MKIKKIISTKSSGNWSYCCCETHANLHDLRNNSLYLSPILFDVWVQQSQYYILEFHSKLFPPVFKYSLQNYLSYFFAGNQYDNSLFRLLLLKLFFKWRWLGVLKRRSIHETSFSLMWQPWQQCGCTIYRYVHSVDKDNFFSVYCKCLKFKCIFIWTNVWGLKQWSSRKRVFTNP